MKWWMRCTAAIILIVFVSGTVLSDEPQYVDGRLLVQFHDDVIPAVGLDGTVQVNVPEVDRLLTRFDAVAMNPFFGPLQSVNEEFMYRIRNDYVIEFPAGTDMELVASEMSMLDDIEWALPDYLIPFDYVPDDPSYANQWFHDNLESARAWDITRGSEEVLVAGIDTGVDWNHPDLVDNIWVNPGEDIDGNPAVYDFFEDLPGTSGDWNYEDDDGNGFVDDFIGYDWVTGVNAYPGEDGNTPDNNPMDFNGHGTGVGASMVQTGDNGVGGVGVAWDSKLICTRCGYQSSSGQGLTSLSAAVSAMAYLIDVAERYDKVVIANMSYGGSSQYQPMMNIVSDAWDTGLLMFGAAGNDGVSAAHYPAAYTEVIAVAATNQGDGRAGFSNYGNWVSISAPGVSCLTAWFNNAYSSWDGTSVASPIAAGVGALVAARFPEESNATWRQIVEDSVDPDNSSQYIGTGRVNAYKAVTQFAWPELTFDWIEVSDPDGNGHPDPGETLEVTFQLSNAEGWQDATLVSGYLEFDNELIDVTTSQILLGNIVNGTSGNNVGNPLVFEVPETGINGEFVMMTLRVESGPNSFEVAETERLLIGTPEVMLLDIDDGDSYESYILDDFHNMATVYNHVDMSVRTSLPTVDEMSLYPVVLVMGGNSTTSFTGDVISVLEGAMDNGVNMFVFGDGIDEQLAGTDFYANYLHAESVPDQAGAVALTPVPDAGAPVVHEGNMFITGQGGAGNNQDPDVIGPVNGAFAAYHYYTNETNYGGIVYEGDDYRLVYFSFAFESVSGVQNTVTRQDFFESLFAWFGTDVDDNLESEVIPESFEIASAYPNPFNPSTTLSIAVPNRAVMNLRIYDVLGREVVQLAQGTYNAGMHQLTWDATLQSSGVYFAVMQAEGMTFTRKLVLMK